MQGKRARLEYLTEFLNKCCDEYYNGSNPTLSDAEYDRLFDELTLLEKELGITLPDSPTQRAGYEVMSELKKVRHDIPLLSLAKTKSASEIYEFACKNKGYLGLKMDGLTVKLVYKDGVLVEASTRGDGEIGEDITHNAKVFKSVPRKLPKAIDLTVSGEAFIDIPTFERINENIDNDEDKYSTPRNLAAGSVRQLDSRICAERGVSFFPFNLLKGFEEIDSKSEKLDILKQFGFNRLPTLNLSKENSLLDTENFIMQLKTLANKKGYPIDGIVFTFDSTAFSKAQGRTSHHFKDGIAYKFGDPTFETTLKNIVWNISRTGQLTPIAEFNPVEIDNTTVEKASLHNMSFIEDLHLKIGDKILVSKRNMIIPHIEKNLSYTNDEYTLLYPDRCPVCNEKTEVDSTALSGKTVKTLYCKNSLCPGRKLKKFTHFVSKQAMNIDGLSEQTLEKLIAEKYIKNFKDIFYLDRFKEEIIAYKGFGVNSYENLINSVEKAKNTHLSNYLVAMNIPLLGKSAAGLIEERFSGSFDEFVEAIKNRFDFTEIDGIGEIMNKEIYNWFDNFENYDEFIITAGELAFERVESKELDENNIFYNKTVVITGSFEGFSRDKLGEILKGYGAKVTSSVSKKTDFVLCGEKAGSKLEKAKSLGVRVIENEELMSLIKTN